MKEKLEIRLASERVAPERIRAFTGWAGAFASMREAPAAIVAMMTGGGALARAVSPCDGWCASVWNLAARWERTSRIFVSGAVGAQTEPGAE